MKTREMPTTILTDGVQAWFNDTPLDQEKYPHIFSHQLIQDQNTIGLRQLFNG
jgi:hypothetical protein